MLPKATRESPDPAHPLILREWHRSDRLALTVAERDTLRTVFGADVQPSSGSNDRFDIRPANTIGAITVGHRPVTVLPKIDISRVLFLLGYAAAPDKWRDDQAVLANATDFSAGIVALYLRHTESAIVRGLLHGYHRQESDLFNVRGRIDLSAQIKRRPGLNIPIAVRYDIHDEDVLENRLLLAAARSLTALPIRDSALRRRLHRVTDTLTDVTPLRYHPSAFPAVAWTRLNEHYRPAVELSRLLLQRTSPELAAGTVAATGLTLNLADVFEDFVRTALREALHVNAQRFPPGDSCPALYLDEQRRIRLKPDLSLWRGSRCEFVGDVKYKRDDSKGSPPDIYQLLTYATATELDSATLIYAHGPDRPARHTVTATGTTLEVLHLDLSKKPEDILADIGRIAVTIQTRIACTTAA